MNSSKISSKTPAIAQTAINLTVIASILVLNYFYQKDGFDFTLKCVCSGLFALLGLFNLLCAFLVRAENKRFYISMAAGLLPPYT